MGKQCEMECPGLSKGKPICYGRGVSKYDEVYKREDKGCYYHSGYDAVLCRCKKSFFGEDPNPDPDPDPDPDPNPLSSGGLFRPVPRKMG